MAVNVNLIEYIVLLLDQDEEQAIAVWRGQYLRAYDASAWDLCDQLWMAIKGGHRLSKRSHAAVLHCRGLRTMLWEPTEAERYYQKSLLLFREAGDRLGEGWVLNDLGTLYYARGAWAQAIVAYREARACLLPARRGTLSEAMVANNLGLALLGIGNVEAGRQELQEARDLYHQLGYAQGEASVMVNLGQVYHDQGDIPLALNTYQAALKMLRTMGNHRVEMEVLDSLGVLYRFQGQLDNAFAYHKQSLALAQSLGNLGGQATVLSNVGAVYQLWDKLPQARQQYEEALALYELLGDAHGQTRLLGNLGHALSLLGEHDAALLRYQQALALSREIGDVTSEALALINLAGGYRSLAQYDMADTFYAQAFALSQHVENVRVKDRALGAWGTLRAIQEHWEEAEAFYQQALALQQQRGDIMAQVETIYKMARLRHERGDSDQVLGTVEPAWNLAQEHGYGRWMIDIVWLLGDAAAAQGNVAAFKYYGAAAVIACQYEDDTSLRVSLAKVQGWVHDLVACGAPEEALMMCQYLLDLWQQPEYHPWAEPAITVILEQADMIHGQLRNGESDA